MRVYTESVPRILLVDDDIDHLKLFTMILENRGYSLDTYSDPAAPLIEIQTLLL